MPFVQGILHQLEFNLVKVYKYTTSPCEIIESSLLNATANRVQNTSFSACEILHREEALVSFVRETRVYLGFGFLERVFVA